MDTTWWSNFPLYIFTEAASGKHSIRLKVNEGTNHRKEKKFLATESHIDLNNMNDQ